MDNELDCFDATTNFKNCDGRECKDCTYFIGEHGNDIPSAASGLSTVNIQAPIPELEGSFPIVLYFGTEEDRNEFMEIVKEAKPNMVVKKL